MKKLWNELNKSERGIVKMLITTLALCLGYMSVVEVFGLYGSYLPYVVLGMGIVAVTEGVIVFRFICKGGQK